MGSMSLKFYLIRALLWLSVAENQICTETLYQEFPNMFLCTDLSSGLGIYTRS